MGWSYAHFAGSQQAMANFRDTVQAEMFFTEFVPDSSISEEWNKKVCDMVGDLHDEGYRLFIGMSFDYQWVWDSGVYGCADKYPDSYFTSCGGFLKGANYGLIFSRAYQVRYLTGLQFGKMKAKTVCYITCKQIPELYRIYDAFAIGVLEENPDAILKVWWTDKWKDTELERYIAEMIVDECDIMAYETDTAEPGKVFAQHGKLSIGTHTDQAMFVGDRSITSVAWNWNIGYTKMISDYIECTSQDTWDFTADDFKCSKLYFLDYYPGLELGLDDVNDDTFDWSKTTVLPMMGFSEDGFSWRTPKDAVQLFNDVRDIMAKSLKGGNPWDGIFCVPSDDTETFNQWPATVMEDWGEMTLLDTAVRKTGIRGGDVPRNMTCMTDYMITGKLWSHVGGKWGDAIIDYGIIALPPKPEKEVMEIWSYSGGAMEGTALAMVIIVSILVAAVTISNCVMAERKIIKMSQWRLDVASCLGILTFVAVLIPLTMDERLNDADTLDTMCKIRAVLPMVGFDLFFGAIGAKLWRLKTIFSQLQTVVITDTDLFKRLGCFIVTIITISIIWILVEEPTREVRTSGEIATDDPFIFHQEHQGYCDMGDIFPIAGLLISAVLVVVVAMWANEVRSLVTYEGCNNALELSYIVLSVTLLSGFTVTIMLLSTNEFVINWISIGVSSLIAIGSIVGSQFKKAYAIFTGTENQQIAFKPASKYGTTKGTTKGTRQSSIPATQNVEEISHLKARIKELEELLTQQQN